MNSVTSWHRPRKETTLAIGVIGASVAIGVTACSGASTNSATTSTTTAPPTAAAPARVGHAPGVVGRITAENGSTWTVAATNGTPYTVTITPQTQFGRKRTPATAQQFPVGSTVWVSGTANGNTITATRIAATRNRHPASTAPTGAPPS
jgi:hypothetical protein